MARYRGTTEQRGLGTAHRADRERLFALHRDGDLCWRCGQPMYKWQKLERDHIVDRANGGVNGPAVLAHQSCNRSAGARAGNQAQPRIIMAAGRDTVCAMCGKPYHYVARRCEVCGAHYHPNGREQRTCGRTCGVALRRRIYGNASGRASKPKPAPKPRRQPEPYAPRSSVTYYTCRYCGELGIAHGTGQQRREVCTRQACQLARLAANNVRTRAQRARAPAAPLWWTSVQPHRARDW